MTGLSGVPADVDDLDDYTYQPHSSSSSADQDGAPSSPGGVVADVRRQDSVSSGDASVDVRAGTVTTRPSGSDSREAAGEYPGRGGSRGDADGWSLKSLPAGRTEYEDDGRSRIDRRSASASELNFRARNTWLSSIGDRTTVCESSNFVDVQPTPDAEEPDVDASDTGVTVEDSPSADGLADDTESGGLRMKSAEAVSSAGGSSADDDVERRRCPSSSSLPPHQMLSAAERLHANKHLLLNSASFEAS